jgi:ferredoxin/flavodoxin---NADP+ reductase
MGAAGRARYALRMAAPAPNAVLAQRTELAPGLAIFRIAPDGWPLPPFTPGQFAVIGLPASAPRVPLSDPEEPGNPERFIRRAYSIASSSRSREYVEIFANLVRSGELTPRLFALPVGGRLWLGPKIKGMFTLRDIPRDAHLAMISTGTGLAPYMSMLRTELDCSGNRRIAVLHGARHSWDLGYAAELYTMQRLCPTFSYLPTVSRPDAEPAPWGGARGYVQELWTRGALERAWGFRPTPANTHVLLCGNPAMIDGMTKILEAQGFRVHDARASGEIHVERYW